jgi:two-component system, cell cycle sensor histidine kinase and response regulator CckA
MAKNRSYSCNSVADESNQAGLFPWVWRVVFVVLALGLSVAAYAYYRHETDRITQQKYEEIAAIGKLKAEQIAQWRLERLRDVERSAGGRFFGKGLQEFLKDRNNMVLEKELQHRLAMELEVKGYADDFVLDLDDRIVLSARPQPEALNPFERDIVEEALATRSAILSDLYRTPQGSVMLIGAAPFPDSAGQPFAMLVLRSNAESVLYPSIQTWPTPSRTAETVLVRKDGDGVLFLNELRHRPNSALSLREPLARHDSAFVQAVLGKMGMFLGTDYRGVEVLADLRPIPDSPWFMVAKVDTSEILAEAHYRQSVAALFIVIFVLLAAAGTAYGYRHRQARLYRDLYRSERDQRDVEAQFRTILYSIGDAVITTNTQGMVKQMNPVAEGLTGWKEGDATGKPLEDVFHIINEKTGEACENPVRKVLRERRVVELANHAILIGRDGTERVLADSGAPIRDENGDIAGVVLAFRDVTERARAAEELQKLASVVRYSSELINLATFDGKMMFLNEAGCRMLGIESADVGQHQIVDVIPEHLLPTVQAEIWPVLMAGGTWEGELQFRNLKTGGLVDFHSMCFPIRDSDTGSPICFANVSRDISAHKKAEETLKAEKRRFEVLAESSPFGLAMIEQDGTFEYVNPMFQEMFGYDKSEVPTGRDWFRLAFPDPDYRHQVIAAWIDDLAVMDTYPSRPRIFTVQCKDGPQKAIHFRPVRLPSGEHIVTYEDITHRRAAEEAIRQSEEKYRTLFEDSPDALFIVTADGTLVDANQAYLDLFGYEKEEILGQRALKTYEDSTHHPLYHLAYGEKGYVKDFPLRLVRKDGRQIDCLVSCRIERDNEGSILRYRGFIRDITEQKILQTQLLQAQKMEAIGTLAGGIAHDFNNLLQVTMGYAEVLQSRRKKADPEYALFQQILQAGRSGAELVRRLLTLSRKTQTKPRPVDVNHQIEHVRRLLGRTLPRMIKIELRLAESLATVNADPTQIEQIIMNLALNARDAMPEGGKLTLSTKNETLDEDYCRVHADAKPRNYVLLAIADTGSGMDKDILDHMFEPFFTTKGVGRGTGLGLAVVYGIVKQHGGHVTCESRPGDGTVFKVYLPSIEEKRTVSDELKEEAKLPGGTETVLLVDDDEVVRNLGELILSESGYTVLTANNGKEALDIYQQDRASISLVILDLNMPEMDGEQCMGELLKISPTVRILIATGYASGGTSKNALELGAKGFVNKPFNMAQLLQEVRGILDTPN